MSAVAQMAEIDLIPADYRNERALLRTIRTVGIVVLALVCAAAALSGVLRHAAAGVRSEMQRLEATASLVNQQRSAIAGLAQRKAALKAKLSLLRGLRSNGAVAETLLTVGHAVPEASVWLLEWRFQRLGAVVATIPDGASDYFVVGDEDPGTSRAVRVEMTIVGQAHDHSAVSAFVSGLLGAPGIEDVRVQRASREGGESAVEFELLIAADSRSVIE